jgi:hypothetical protein
MAEAKDCPKCGLVNPPEAQRCDCGWDFGSRSAQQSYNPKAATDLQRRRRIGYICGLIGFSIMSIQGLVSTLNPKPDGRVLNSAPAIGIDVFLFVGILGIIFCAIQLVRGR